MNLHTLLFTENECYKIGRPLAVKGIMVHSTGANNNTLKRYVGPDDGLLGYNKFGNHYNRFRPDGRQVCPHAFIGKLQDGSIATYQNLPWNMRGWHGGSGPKGNVNDTHIGFEICEDGLTDPTYFAQIYKEAAELCAYLCKMFNLNPLADGVLICHCEGYSRGIATNHSDVMHWFPKHGKSMASFRDDVAKLLVVPAPPVQPSQPAQPAGFTPYIVNVTIPDLNIRTGPGTNNGTNGVTGVGSFTIVDEAQGQGATKWGRLKSGAGWISLDFVDKKPAPAAPKELAIGDVVNFAGGTHYGGSDGSKPSKASKGKAKITNIAKGAKYPYHLIHTDKTSNVYGWVAASTITR